MLCSILLWCSEILTE